MLLISRSPDHKSTARPKTDMGIGKVAWALLHLSAICLTTPTERRASAIEYHAAPYYPAPYGGWVNDWKKSYEKAKKLVDSMTLAEKTNITAGTGLYMGMSPLD
jgi:beta-glucosidase